MVMRVPLALFDNHFAFATQHLSYASNTILQHIMDLAVNNLHGLASTYLDEFGHA